MVLINLNSVSKKLDGDNYAVKSIDLSVTLHSKVGVVGETGSGKSTLLRLIAGLEQKDAGAILFDSKKVKGPQEQLIAGHPEMKYLSQYFELSEFITVAEYLDNIYLIGEEEAEKIYNACQIEHLLSKDTRHLSGGEKQRVALAKALTYEPKVLLLDEPFSNLDFHHKKIIKEVLSQVEKELSTTMILVSHDPKDVLSWADEIIVMRKGEIVQKGTPKGLYDNPSDEYVAGLFGNYHLVNPERWGLEKADQFPLIDGKALVRPEQFIVSKTGKNGLGGIVEKLNYHGGYDEVLIETKEGRIQTTSNEGVYQPGNKVVMKVQF